MLAFFCFYPNIIKRYYLGLVENMKKGILLGIIACLILGILFTTNMFLFEKEGFGYKNIFAIKDIVYRNDDGDLMYGLQKIDGNTYYFDPDSGVMHKGLLELDKNTYYFNEDGKMDTGFKQIEDSCYYFDLNTGTMYKDQFCHTTERISYFGHDGKMVKGTVDVNGKAYNFDQNGQLTLDYDQISEVIEQYIEEETGQISIYFKDLRTDTTYTYKENDSFYPCSSIKFCVLLAFYHEVSLGNIEMDDTCKSLLEDMIIMSDNGAHNKLVRMIGNKSGKKGLKKINAYLDSIGIEKTRAHHSLQPDDDQFNDGTKKQNTTRASDMGKMMEMLYRNELFDAKTTNEIIELLNRCADGNALRRGIPYSVKFAHKTGCVENKYLDSGIVYGSNGAFVLCVFVDDMLNKYEFFRNVGSYFYHYVENLYVEE